MSTIPFQYDGLESCVHFLEKKIGWVYVKDDYQFDGWVSCKWFSKFFELKKIDYMQDYSNYFVQVLYVTVLRYGACTFFPQ